MSLSISVTVQGDKEVQRKLKRLGNTITHLHAAMIVIGKDATHYYETVGFIDKGRAFGNPWPELSRNTLKMKQKKWAGRNTLERTGDMRRGFYAEADNDSVTIGNKVNYYKYHQSSAARSKLPRRQMAGINNPIKRMVQEAIRDEVTRKINTA